VKSDRTTTPTPTPKPPTGWRDPLDPSQAANVKSAIDLLGGPPGTWREAHQESRIAAWRVIAESSLHLIQERDYTAQILSERQATHAARPLALTLKSAVASAEALLAVAQSMVDASPGEAERLRLRDERAARKRALEEAPRESLRNLVATDGRLLVEAVTADALAIVAEREAVQALQAEAEAARVAALDVLGDELDRALMHEARLVSSLLKGRQLLIGAAHPSLTDPRILQSWRRGLALAAASATLDGRALDVDRTFARELDAAQLTVFSQIIGAGAVRFLAEARRMRAKN
jgi:hypothetical protein